MRPANSISSQAAVQSEIGLKPHELATFLRKAGKVLNALNGSSEEEFLRLGAGLHDFQERAGDISAIAQELVNLVAGEEISDGTRSLDRTVGRMDFILKNALEKNGQSSSTLSRI